MTGLATTKCPESPHDKLISVYDRLSLAEQQALLAALDALDAADEPEPTSATPPRGAGAAGLVPY